MLPGKGFLADATSRCASKEIAPGSDTCCIIVNWNCANDTLECVKGIFDNYPKIGCVVVDNASSVDEFEILAKKLPKRANLIRMPQNGGYASGVNAGLEFINSRRWRWVWLINPDSRPLQGCLEELIKFRDHAVAISPAQLTSESPAKSGKIYTCAAQIVRGKVRAVSCDGCSNGVHDVSVVTGTGLLINADAANAAGGLNEDFFHYKEEFEFIERLSSFGAVRLVCTARIWHQRGASLSHNSQLAQYYRWRNEILYLRIRGGKRWWMGMKVIRLLVRGCLPTNRSHWKYLSVRMAGLSDGLVGVTGSRKM